MVKFIFQFPYSSLSFFEQLPNRAGMFVAFGRQSNEVFKPIIIPFPIDVMNVPTCWRCAISLFPNKNMFPNLAPCISSRMVRHINPDVSCRAFPSATFPVRILLPPSHFRTAFQTAVVMTVYWYATYSASSFVNLFVFATILSLVLPMFLFIRVFTQSFMETLEAPLGRWVNQFPTINAMVISYFPLVLSSFILAHHLNYSIAYSNKQPSRSRG